MRRLSLLSTFFAASSLAASAFAAPSVWVVDDGEKIAKGATSPPFAAGAENAVWSPGQPVRLFALRGETVAFQVVVTTDATAVDGVTVDLDALTSGAGTIANDPGATDPTSFVGRRIERFVEHDVDVPRRSGGTDPSASLGWESGSRPSGDFTGLWPDPLIPVEVAPSWAPYPMHVDANANGAIWIDVTVPASTAPAVYAGHVVVAAGGATLATLPVELEVRDAVLPDRALSTMLYYDWAELDSRIGNGDAAEKHLFQLYRRHHLTPMHSVYAPSDVTRQLSALDGSLYTAANGYEGPGEGEPDGIVSIGSYGVLGAPTSSAVSNVESIADQLASHGVLGTADVFLYPIDESCGSSLGTQWKQALAASSDPHAQAVKVGWTCSQDPSSQPVDIVMVFSGEYDPGRAAAARQAGKRVWIYNGEVPQSGTFFTDAEAIEPRVNGWIGARFATDRWFYWETTFWYDGNHGGHGPYDPFATAETFHNQYGDWCEGDGVLVYPGKQVDMFTSHSIGMEGVIASIRLKNLRRGIEDAGYYALAHAASPSAADAIVDGLLPSALSAATHHQPMSWSARGEAFTQARKALFDLVAAPPPPTSSASSSASSGGSGGASAVGAGGGGTVGSGAAGAGGGSSATAAGVGGSGDPSGGGGVGFHSGGAGASGGCSFTPGRADGAFAVATLALAAALARRRSGRR
ncbi:MAG TPA: glycoside hydrolase domain-containing protein [Minicystis sp.]|nr:glycoside hydrolase domain-containing protein [Minicystis sp.]